MSEFGNSGKWSWEIQKEQQAKIDDLKTQLNNMERCYIQVKKINDEQSEIIQGHFAARNELQKQIDTALFKIRQQSLMLHEDMDGYKDPVQLCQSEGFDMCVKILEEALRSGDQNTKNKAQSTENIGHQGGDQKAMIEATQEQNR